MFTTDDSSRRGIQCSKRRRQQFLVRLHVPYPQLRFPLSTSLYSPEAVDMNGRFQMQGGKNWFLPKEMNANRFFCDSRWLEIWSNQFYPSMGPNGGSVAMDSAEQHQNSKRRPIYWILIKMVYDIQKVSHNISERCLFSYPTLARCIFYYIAII